MPVGGKGKKPHAAVNIKCPWCTKKIDVEIHKDTVEPAVPAETKIRTVVKKDGQTTLFEMPSKKPKGKTVKTRKAVKGKATKKKGSKK